MTFVRSNGWKIQEPWGDLTFIPKVHKNLIYSRQIHSANELPSLPSVAWTSYQPWPRALVQTSTEKFKCLSKPFRWQALGLGKVSGKSHTNRLSPGISALSLLVLARARKCRGVCSCEKYWGGVWGGGPQGNVVRTFPNLQKHIWLKLNSPILGRLFCLIAFVHPPYWKCQKFLTWQWQFNKQNAEKCDMVKAYIKILPLAFLKKMCSIRFWTGPLITDLPICSQPRMT